MIFNDSCSVHCSTNISVQKHYLICSLLFGRSMSTVRSKFISCLLKGLASFRDLFSGIKNIFSSSMASIYSTKFVWVSHKSLRHCRRIPLAFYKSSVLTFEVFQKLHPTRRCASLVNYELFNWEKKCICLVAVMLCGDTQYWDDGDCVLLTVL